MVACDCHPSTWWLDKTAFRLSQPGLHNETLSPIPNKRKSGEEGVCGSGKYVPRRPRDLSLNPKSTQKAGYGCVPLGVGLEGPGDLLDPQPGGTGELCAP